MARRMSDRLPHRKYRYRVVANGSSTSSNIARSRGASHGALFFFYIIKPLSALPFFDLKQRKTPAQAGVSTSSHTLDLFPQMSTEQFHPLPKARDHSILDHHSKDF